jgi:peroxiredoxin Q/BCP
MDTIESHREFAAKHGLEFPLVADPDGKIAAQYGVSTREGFAERVTFVIGRDGNVARVFPEVEIAGHADAVLAAIGELTR